MRAANQDRVSRVTFFFLLVYACFFFFFLTIFLEADGMLITVCQVLTKIFFTKFRSIKYALFLFPCYLSLGSDFSWQMSILFFKKSDYKLSLSHFWNIGKIPDSWMLYTCRFNVQHFLMKSPASRTWPPSTALVSFIKKDVKFHTSIILKCVHIFLSNALTHSGKIMLDSWSTCFVFVFPFAKRHLLLLMALSGH